MNACLVKYDMSSRGVFLCFSQCSMNFGVKVVMVLANQTFGSFWIKHSKRNSTKSQPKTCLLKEKTWCSDGESWKVLAAE